MALIKKSTNEYLKIKSVNIFTGKVEIEVFKNKDTRNNLTKWDKIDIKNIIIPLSKFKNKSDSAKSVEDSVLAKTYEIIKESHFLEENYDNDL